MNRLILLCVCGFLLGGCAAPRDSSLTEVQVEKFKLSTGQDGRVYRINNQTGGVWLVGDGALQKIDEQKPERLKVGQKYFIEDNFSVVYLGAGKFTEPVKDYSHLWK